MSVAYTCTCGVAVVGERPDGKKVVIFDFNGRLRLRTGTKRIHHCNRKKR